MARKTLTEQVLELQVVVARLEERSEYLRGDVEWSDASITKLGQEIRDLQIRLKVLESKYEDLKRAHDETERRRWQLWVVGVAAVLSLVANLVLTFARKPS